MTTPKRRNSGRANGHKVRWLFSNLLSWDNGAVEQPVALPFTRCAKNQNATVWRIRISAEVFCYIIKINALFATVIHSLVVYAAVLAELRHYPLSKPDPDVSRRPKRGILSGVEREVERQGELRAASLHHYTACRRCLDILDMVCREDLDTPSALSRSISLKYLARRSSANRITAFSQSSGGERWAFASARRRACRTLATETPSALAKSSWETPAHKHSVASRKSMYAVLLTSRIRQSYCIQGHRGSPMNRVPLTRRTQVISALVEGNSIRTVERMTGTHRDTLMRLLVGLAQGAKRWSTGTCDPPAAARSSRFRKRTPGQRHWATLVRTGLHIRPRDAEWRGARDRDAGSGRVCEGAAPKHCARHSCPKRPLP